MFKVFIRDSKDLEANIRKIAIAIVETEEKAQTVASEWNHAHERSSKAEYEAIQ